MPKSLDFMFKGNRKPLKGCRHTFAFRKAIGCWVKVGWESRMAEAVAEWQIGSCGVRPLQWVM